jgi:hypothetical protein
MLDVKELGSWEAFESEIEGLFSAVKNRRSETDTYVSEPLFRGLADSNWGLQTTLERYSAKEYTVRPYFEIIRGVRPEAQSFTGKTWDFDPDFAQFADGHRSIEEYECMIYLRHHGFPSPLLDWTRSPYVAAFFAFQPNIASKDGRAAIYSYIENWGYGKSGSSYSVGTVGGYVTTDRRHHIQQCEYTYATKKVGDGRAYCNHETALEETKELEQDMLTKYLIPRSERPKVLAKLDLMTINSYALFGDEKGLMEHLAYREIERKI